LLKKELKETTAWCTEHKDLILLLLNPDYDYSDIGFAAIVQLKTPLGRMRDKSRHIIRPVDEK